MNKTEIIGNLTRNPESRIVSTADGQLTVCNFTVAVDRYVKGKKLTAFYRVSCWNKNAENAMKYLGSGSKVYVCGVVSAHAYKSNSGEPRASLELSAEDIEYLSSRRDNTQEGQTPPPAPEDMGFMDIPDGMADDLPFA